MKTVTVFLAVLVASMIAADGSPLQAQEVPKGKEVFISRELARTNIFSDTSLYSISRSRANADLIVLWERGFGFDPARVSGLAFGFGVSRLAGEFTGANMRELYGMDMRVFKGLKK